MLGEQRGDAPERIFTDRGQSFVDTRAYQSPVLVLNVPFSPRRILLIEATPAFKVVRHASQFLISSRYPVSGLAKSKAATIFE